MKYAYQKNIAKQFAGRNADIARLVDEGELSCDEIGKRYKITGERVRQIARKYNLVLCPTNKPKRKIKKTRKGA